MAAPMVDPFFVERITLKMQVKESGERVTITVQIKHVHVMSGTKKAS